MSGFAYPPSPLKFLRHAPATFLDRAGPFLERAEAENNLLLGIGASLARGEMTLSALPVVATVEDGDEVVLAALRTPPHNLLLSTGTERALAVLCDALKADGTGLPGVTGPADLAAVFAERWAGDACERVMTQHVYQCTEVVAPKDPGGAFRAARLQELDRLVAYVVAFNEEANNPGTEASARRMVKGLVEKARIFVWDADGDIVSIATARQPPPHGIRVGYVYTPPVERRKGYASAITAKVTQRMFDEGYQMCFLYTDASNPTSNAIYQRVGYEPMGDSAMWRFTA